MCGVLGYLDFAPDALVAVALKNQPSRLLPNLSRLSFLWHLFLISTYLTAPLLTSPQRNLSCRAKTRLTRPHYSVISKETTENRPIPIDRPSAKPTKVPASFRTDSI